MHARRDGQLPGTAGNWNSRPQAVAHPPRNSCRQRLVPRYSGRSSVTVCGGEISEAVAMVLWCKPDRRTYGTSSVAAGTSTVIADPGRRAGLTLAHYVAMVNRYPR